MTYSIVIKKVFEWSFLALLSKKVTECVECKALGKEKGTSETNDRFE